MTDRRPLPHEWALLAVGAATSAALLPRPLAGPVAAATLLLAAATRAPMKVRLAAGYAFVVGFYFCVEHFVVALGTPARDPYLRAADEAAFGRMPAVAAAALAAPWLTEVASACYLTYFVYLHAALGFALLGPGDRAVRYFGPVGLAFAVGFAGYLLVPAVSPGVAYPGEFGPPPVEWPLAAFNSRLVAGGSSVYDSFPSLHVLVTGVLLREDWASRRRRFWLMVWPAAGLLFATLYLRYHYAIDLVVGLALIEPVWRVGAGRLPGARAAGTLKA